MEYRAITGENFYYSELKSVARYLLKYPNSENLREELKKNDLLDTISESNFNKKFFSINKRVKFLTETLKENLVFGDSCTGKFINLYTILCSERIIFEFMDEVVREKYKNFEYFIKENEFKNFILLKSEQSDVVDSWSEAGKKKMIIKIKNFLIESGYLIKEENEYKIIKPIILNEVIDEIKNNDRANVIKIMLY